jgi:small nuclear ribonucleoprotein (snRNP)-like protein
MVGLVKILEIAILCDVLIKTKHPQCVNPPLYVANCLVFYSFFKTLVDQEVTVELKNDLAIKGILKSVDQFLNIKLDEISVLEENKYPHLVVP